MNDELLIMNYNAIMPQKNTLPELSAILACPICKGKLRYDKDNAELICRFDKLAYPVRNGVPIMLIEQARKIKEE